MARIADYDVSVYFHFVKANIVAYALSQLSMVRMCHVDEEKKDSVKEVHQLARLGVWLADALSGGVSFNSSSEYTFLVDAKANQQLDPVLVELKDLVFSKLNESFSLRGDDVLRY